MPNRAVFAGGIQALEDDQQSASSLCIHQVLKAVQLSDSLPKALLRFPALLPAQRGIRIVMRQFYFPAWLYQEFPVEVRRHRIIFSPLNPGSGRASGKNIAFCVERLCRDVVPILAPGESAL